MKRILLLSVMALFLVAGCAPQKEDSLPPETPETSQATDLSSTEPPSQGEEVKPVNPDVKKYFDYFMKNDYVSMLLGDETGGKGFSDAQMAAYALCELIKQSAGDYEQEIGFPKEDFDHMTLKYFGTTVQKHENRMATVIPETGNITSTGWDGASLCFILKELTAESDGMSSGVFYVLSFNMGEYQSSMESDLLQGLFDDNRRPFLITIVFEEKIDENGEMYLRYDDIKQEGKAAPPYVLYQG